MRMLRWIAIGSFGLVGLELRILLMVLPVLRAAFKGWATRRRSGPDAALIAGLMAALTLRAVDVLPNGWWNDMPIFLAGALWSLSASPEEAPAEKAAAPARVAEAQPASASLSRLLGSRRRARGRPA